jgi:pimeloyl-ACP methyl ester carboxylesterase
LISVFKSRRPTWLATRLAVFCLMVVIAGASACAWEQTSGAGNANDRETVVLLHGLGRSKSAMWLLALRIEAAGFDVMRIGYDSLGAPPERIVASVSQGIDACCKEAPRPVHLVGHSLGGLIIRAYLAENELRTPGRVVLIATPNAGTPLVDAYRESWWMDLAGPTAKSLGTEPDSFPNSLPAADYPVGVIAGIRDARFVDLIPGDDDGLVPLESTKVAGMIDFIIVKSNHAWMRYSRDVARQTIAFLRTGEFLRDRGALASDPEGTTSDDDVVLKAKDGGRTDADP